jgi:hypothetical protein
MYLRKFKSEVEDAMKFQNRIRMQMLMVGLGAALFMAGSARAQQEMDPTYFDVKPGAPAVTKSAVVPAAEPRAAAQSERSENAATLASIQESTLEGGVMRMTFVDVGVVLILLAGVVSIAAYAMAATRRERRLRVSSMSAPYTPTSAATAQ